MSGSVNGGSAPIEPGEVIAWVGEVWTEEGWDASQKKKYMRAWGDEGWHRRMVGMQGLVRAGERSVGPLVETLNQGEAGMRVFAAQTLGFLGPLAPRDALEAALQDPETAVRLYAVDALGMSGVGGLADLLGPMKISEKDRDVKKHIAYALLRAGTPIDVSVVDTLLAWDSETIDRAAVGELAPDFELTALTGESIRLSDFRGEKAVVLVFIYGDT